MNRGEPTILVVDDEPEVGRYIAGTLSRSGFHTLLASGGREALHIYRNRHAEIDLVLSDLVMSDLPGPELMRALRTIRDDVQVLFMSGYSAEHSRRFGQELDGCDVLSKPFTPAELMQGVRHALGVPLTSSGASGS